jgi:hypothetical protein|tara:strand:+ start:48 stop:167 length:120 start_codon:yes stop_codon:yes gene_type:complete
MIYKLSDLTDEDWIEIEAEADARNVSVETVLEDWGIQDN